MKRFTLLTMLVALFSAMAFAQKDSKLPLWQGKVSDLSTTIKGVERQAQPSNTASRRAGEETVTPPSTATVETWYFADGAFYTYGRYGFQEDNANAPNINVAFDGSDIYIQGLAHYYPDGWIKGTISGNTAVFANSQLAGSDGFGIYYILGSDDALTLSESIVFSFDATQGILKAAVSYIFESPEPTASEDGIASYAFWVMPTFTKEQPKGPEPVVAPEGLKTEEWAVSAADNYGAPVSTYFQIGFDGNDVYLQGFTHYLPETWLKGTLSEDGKTITFEGNQYFGPYDDADGYTHYEFYLMRDGFVLTYDAEAGKMTGQGELYVSEAIRQYKGDVYNNPVITKVVEKAGKPATPTITQIYSATTGPVVMFNIPVTDVDGNAMVSQKVNFQFFKDIEEEISPVTFEPADYIKLSEPMTVFPYGFTDNYELFYNYMYLNQKDYSRWNKIGLQVIYTGGGEENKSDIFWLDIKPYEKTTFNFNAMDVACSSNDSNDGDITEDRSFTANNVTLTISPKTEEATSPNRFWSTKEGPQLRVYSGTLTFEAPVGKVFTKMMFNYGKWNNGNNANSGEITNDADAKVATWTGEARKVVVNIAGNTQLNSIDVYPSDMTLVAIEAPEGLVTDTYVFKANSLKPYYDPAELTLWVEAGFNGDDLYIQGLATDYNSSASELWVKATKNEAGQYVIPANQFMGDIQFWMSSMPCFFTGVDADGNMVDAVLDYDAEKGQFTTAQSLAINSQLTTLEVQQTFTNVVMTKFDEVAATPAAPTINSIDFGEWSHYIACTIPDVGTNGETLNPNKLFYMIWIEENGEQKPYVFKADVYYADKDETELPYSKNYSTWNNCHEIYFYDEAEVFSTWSKVGIQSIYYGGNETKKTDIVWIENPNVTGISNVNVDMKAGKAVIYNIGGQRLNAPRKGLNIINGRKVVVK